MTKFVFFLLFLDWKFQYKNGLQNFKIFSAADIEDKLRSFDSPTNAKLDVKKVSAASFCFKRALVLETNGKILLEYGQFLYWLAVQYEVNDEENLSKAEETFKKGWSS